MERAVGRVHGFGAIRGAPPALVTLLAVALVAALPVAAGAAIQFDRAAYSAGEADPAAVVTITRTGDPGAAARVTVATVSGGTAVAGTDYVARSGVLTFAAGESSKTFLITLRDNTLVNPDRTVRLALSSPVGDTLGAPATAVLTIVNDDQGGTIQFTSAAYEVTENAGQAAIAVSRPGTNLARGVTVRFATVAGGTAVAGTDYTAVTGLLTFAAGETNRSFSVPIRNNTVVNPDKTVRLALSSPAGGGVLATPAEATLTIRDDDVAGIVQFEQASFTVSERGPAAVIAVTRTGGAASGVSVGFAAGAGGTASATTDYRPVSGRLTFAANEARKTFTVPIVNDTVVELDETVALELREPGGGATLGAQSAATLTIIDDDAPLLRFGAAAYTVAEGGTATVTVARAGGLGSLVTVDYATGDSSASAPDDYTPASGTLTFEPGRTARTFPVATAPDSLAQGPVTVLLTLATPRVPSLDASLGAIVGPNPVVLTIGDNDRGGMIQFGAAQYRASEAVGVTRLPVLRGGTSLAGNVSVDYAVVGGTATVLRDYLPVEGTLTFGPGQASASIDVTLIDTADPDGDRTVVLELSNPRGSGTLGARRRTTLVILDAESSVQFSAATYSAPETAAGATITLTRAGPLIGPVTVDYATVPGGTAVENQDYRGVAGRLTFAAGTASRRFTVPILGDRLADGPKTVHLALGNTSGSLQLGPRATAILTIADDDQGGVIQFGGPTYEVNEGATASITVVRSGSNLAAGVSIQFATTAGGTAAAGADYEPTSGRLTFGAGQRTLTFPVVTLADGVEDTIETVRLALADAAGGGTLGPLTTAVLQIRGPAPDLVVTGVSSPTAAFTGKVIASAPTVKNVGLRSSGPSRVGIFLSRQAVAGTGTLLALVDVPALAPGQSAPIPTSVPIPDGFAQGSHYLIAVADPEDLVAEANEDNNGRIAVAPIVVTRGLNKIASVNAALTIPISTVTACAPISGQSIALAGTLEFTAGALSGRADLDGDFSGDPTRHTRFFGGFTATVDALDNVTITFTFTGVSGFVNGTATATARGRVAYADEERRTGIQFVSDPGGVQGDIRPLAGGVCPFTGSLEADAELVRYLRLSIGARAGEFTGDALTPTVAFPVPIDFFAAVFLVAFDTPGTLPDVSDVLFTGPPGSSLSATPADPVSVLDQEEGTGRYFSPIIRDAADGPPDGTWTVVYKGTTFAFEVRAEASTRTVIPVPTVTVDDTGRLARIDWVYRNRLTGAVIAPPPFVEGIAVVIYDGTFRAVCFGGILARSIATFDALQGCSSPLAWSDVSIIAFLYADSLTDSIYNVDYLKP
jgi:hypothetical protein